MAWTCKYDINGFCEKLQKICLPNQKGCVLHKRFKFVENNTPETPPKNDKGNQDKNGLLHGGLC
ncbi:MAG: hypothetical protein AB1656_00300 [Candidatus Omnitrophota bacterium]